MRTQEEQRDYMRRRRGTKREQSLTYGREYWEKRKSVYGGRQHRPGRASKRNRRRY